jgi:signal transduction histidine kinase
MRFTSTDGLLVPAKLWEPAAFHAYERDNYLRQALYFGTALATASTLQETTQDLQNAIERGELKKSTLTYFVEGALPMTHIILSSCQRAANLISSFKQVAVDQTSEQRRNFDFHALVEDNIAALRPSMRNAPVEIVINVEKGIECDSYPGPLGQVIANLVQNAVVHAFAGRQSGRLTISAQLQRNTVAMQIVDNGKGMDQAVLARILEPFYTTRLGQGRAARVWVCPFRSIW